MSNLIKSAYFNVSAEKMRVIDSDLKAEELVPELVTFQPQNFERDESNNDMSLWNDISSSNGDAENGVSMDVGEFQNGLHTVVNMDTLRQEEKEKILLEAQSEAEVIVQMAQSEAQDIIRRAQKASDEIKNNAYEEGKVSGMKYGRDQAALQLQQERQELEEEMQQLRNQINQEVSEIEPYFASLVCQLVEKLTGVVCSEENEIIVHILDQAIKNLDKTQKIIVRVSQEDMILVTSHQEELMKGIGDDVSFEIVEDASLQTNQCIIETDQKVIDCSLDEQLKGLQRQVRMISMMS